MANLEYGTRGVCRFCGGSLVWWLADEESDRFGTGFMVRRIKRPHWFHTNPDPAAPNAERNIVKDSERGLLGMGCPEKEGTVEGRMGEPREYCCEYKQANERGESNVCNNPVIDNEEMMCGVHLKKVQEERLRKERSRESNESRRAYEEGLREQCIRIEANWNLKAKPYNGYGYGLEGGVIVDPDILEDLLESLMTSTSKKGRKKTDAEAQG